MRLRVSSPVVRGDLHGPRTLGGRLGALIAAGVVALGLMVSALMPSSAARHPRAVGARGAAALGRLQSLPLQAQSVISGALGSGAAAFAAERRTDGYGLAGGGVAADLNARGVGLRVKGGTLSLALAGVGRGARLVVPERATLSANGNRVAYQHAGVREWYAAGPLGIEQGYIVTQRPAGVAAPLTLALRVGGSLRAQLAGSQVRFLASSGAVRARYGGLTAVDASARRLRATLALQGNRLLLRIADRGARYPVRIDPFIQQGPKLTADDETGQGAFGWSVALSADGNTALIGSPRDNSAGDLYGAGVGAAWVFTRAGGTWTQQGPKLTANDETGHGGFGLSVALSADGNTALIGGAWDSNDVGAAWVFTRSGARWTQQGPKLAANDETGQGAFGWSVAMSADGNTALIGGLNDNSGIGAAWVFTRAGVAWTQQGPKLTASNAVGIFGFSVALSADGNTALISGEFNAGQGVGAAWVFTRTSGTWIQGPNLNANNTGLGTFHLDLALSADGNTALIGAVGDNNAVGAAWVFTRSGGTWTQQGIKLTANDEIGRGAFGWSVALSADGNIGLIGGLPQDNNVGAAWVFTRSGATWTQEGPKLTADDETGQAAFGSSVALAADGSTALIGGYSDNNSLGAVWVFGAPRVASPLVGSSQIQPNVDSNRAGTAEAFRYTALGRGSASKLSVYLDSTNAARTVMVGLYSNTRAGNPGRLLTSGTITKPIAGAWNTVTVPATAVNAGTDYWLAVLAPRKAGAIQFRDLPDGTGGPNQTSKQKSLRSLPHAWRTGTRYANSPASLYARTQPTAPAG